MFADAGCSLAQRARLRAIEPVLCCTRAAESLDRSAPPGGAAPLIEAIPHFAWIIGNARSGDPERAEQNLQALSTLLGVLLKATRPNWARQVEIAHAIASDSVAEAQLKTAES